MKKDKSSWIALHSEEQHDTFSSLVKAVESEKAEHFEHAALRSKAEKEEVDNRLRTCQIDVISEEHLRDYLTIIDSEMVKIKKVFQCQRQKVSLSIRKIVEQVRSLKKNQNPTENTSNS